MKTKDSYKIIDIERPFYFLCGPSIKRSKKRNVLASFLKKHYHKKKIRPFPIIVDEIFDSPLIKKHNLNLVLLEEIVAATSLKTYIFLDSLSTAYELGLFKNSKSNNSIRILVEQPYKKRERREVGQYILKSVGSSNFLKYQAENTGNIDLEYFEFKDNKISKSIVNCVEKEMMEYEKNLQSISITNTDKNDQNSVLVTINSHLINVSFSLKSLFYMMETFLYEKYTSYKKITEIDNKAFTKLYNDFLSFVKRQCLLKLGSKIDKVTVFDNPHIKIDQFGEDKVFDIIRHTYFFFVLLTQNKSSLHRLSRRDAFHDVEKANAHSFSLSILFEQIENRVTNTIYSYLNNPDLYVESISYVINKKLRKIYKYRDNYKGRQLRYVHEKITKMLDLILPTSTLSFAYKQGQNTLKCISVHKDSSNFLKLDIHHYFESIKYRDFQKHFMKQLSKNLKNNGIKDDEYYEKDEFNKYLKALFYKGHIPLGFISSPKVSDFYLKSVDDWMEKNKLVKYSRYADDILISTSDTSYSFDDIKNHFEKRIKYKGLTINKDKVICRKLISNGDCIKFLGICLVRKGNNNEIRISKHYIKETIKECYKAKDKGILEDEQLLGKVRYIKLISEKSFEKMLKALSSSEYGKTIATILKHKTK